MTICAHILFPLKSNHSVYIDKYDCNRNHEAEKWFHPRLYFMPLPVLASAMKLSQPQPNLLQQNRARTSEPRGRMVDDTMKSQKSSQVVPAANGSNLNTLNPSAVVKASRKIVIPHTRHPFGLDQPVRSLIIARMFHIHRARLTSLQNHKHENRLPHIRPPDILLNTVAMVSKRRLGPALTSRPYVKQAGK